MDMDFGIYSLYSNLINTKVKFCSLCFKIVKEDAACVQDSVILGFDEDENTEVSYSEEVSVQYLLQEILGELTASYLSETDAICDKCIQAAISSYKFAKMCKTNMERMATTLDLFTTRIDDPDIDINGKNTLFLSMNYQDSTCIRYFDATKFNSNKAALARFQSLFRSYRPVVDNEGNVLFECTKCLVSYPNALSARRHFNSKHIHDPKVKKELQNLRTVADEGYTTKLDKKSRKPPSCFICNEEFENKYILTKHILTEHCIEVDKDFSGLEPNKDIYNYVFSEFTDESGSEKYRCIVCGNLFKSSLNVITHFKKQHLIWHEFGELFICSHCGKEYNDQNQLKRHEEHHTLKFTCPTCKKEYKSKISFSKHVCYKDRSRSEMKRDLICGHCGKTFASKTSLKIHIRYYHGPQSQQFKCEHCPKTFGAYSTWKGHQVKHTRERNFSCEICGNVFVTQMALVYHTRIHTGERPYQCKHCDMRFLSSSRRADHVKRHHIVSMVSCDICGATVKAVGLAKHKRRHKNVNSTLYINEDGEFWKKGPKVVVRRSYQRQLKYESDSDSD